MEQIRQIKITELQDCIKVINESFATVAREFNLTEQNCPRHPSFMKIDTLQQRYADGYQMYGLYEQDKLVGYVSISVDDNNAAELHNLAVLPGYRHKGYGKSLLDFCEKKAKEMGCNKIKIDIIEENKVLKDWYLKNGFVHLFTKIFNHLPFTVGFMEKYI
ncbi:MAG TPA: GNAT family N-acetyltransferase [Thermoclostridium sp.]